MSNELARKHEIEKIYMQQLQNAETAVFVLNQKIGSTSANINRLKAPIAKEREPYLPSFSDYFDSQVFFALPAIVIGIILAVLLIVKFLVSTSEILKILFSWLMSLVTIVFYIALALGILVAIFGIFSTIHDYFEYKKAVKEHYVELKNIRATNEHRDLKTKQNFSKAQQLSVTLKDIVQECEQAKEIRNELYNIDWIPNRYRNIRVIYYISDMVNSSNISIEEALKFYLLQEANNKLDEVLHKMDNIIENQKEIIINQAILNSKNDDIIKQNKTIIEQQSRIEENTRLSAEYSQLGAQYSKANAYFSLASYLDNHK